MNIDDLKRVIVEQREEIDEILSNEKIIEKESPAAEQTEISGSAKLKYQGGRP